MGLGIGKFFKKISPGNKVANYAEKILDKVKDDNELLIDASTDIKILGVVVGHADTKFRIRVADLLPEEGGE